MNEASLRILRNLRFQFYDILEKGKNYRNGK